MAIDANLGVGVQAGRVVFCPFVVAGRSHLGSGMGRLKGRRQDLALVLSSFFFLNLNYLRNLVLLDLGTVSRSWECPDIETLGLTVFFPCVPGSSPR